MIKRFILTMAILAAVLSTTCLIGCGDTWQGFGKDVEDVGENIQE